MTLQDRNRKPFIIAGPCVIESETLCLFVASELACIASSLNVPIIFKASYDKANRSSANAFRGVGLEEGCRILAKVKSETGLKVTTDIHECYHAVFVKEICDVIQIPALLSRQTDLILSARGTGKPVNVKIGQFMSSDIGSVVEKAGSDCMVTYRGTSYGGKTLIDFEMMSNLKQYGVPVIFDASHSGFSSKISEHTASASLGLGADGLFFEVHPEPENALCDGKTTIKLSDFEEMLKRILNR